MATIFTVGSYICHWKDDVISHLITSFSVKHETNSSAERERGKHGKRFEDRGENVKLSCENTSQFIRGMSAFLTHLRSVIIHFK